MFRIYSLGDQITSWPTKLFKTASSLHNRGLKFIVHQITNFPGFFKLPYESKYGVSYTVGKLLLSLHNRGLVWIDMSNNWNCALVNTKQENRLKCHFRHVNTNFLQNVRSLEAAKVNE